MTEPDEVVLSNDEAMPVIAKVEEVALVRSVVPKSVVDARRFWVSEFNTPLMVVEPVTAREVEVAPFSEVPPRTVRVLLALRAPFTLRSEARVVDPVTAKVPVLVAPVVVRPPLKATSEVVAPPGNG